MHQAGLVLLGGLALALVWQPEPRCGWAIATLDLMMLCETAWLVARSWHDGLPRLTGWLEGIALMLGVGAMAVVGLGPLAR